MPCDLGARRRRVPLRTRGFYSVRVPLGRGGGRRPALIALHGYGGNRESLLAFAARLVGEGWVVAALQGTHQHAVRRRGGGLRAVYGWGTQGDQEANQALHHAFLLAVIRDLVRACRADPRRIFLFGFSQSVGLNYRFVFTQPGRIRGVVAVCGGVPRARAVARAGPGAPAACRRACGLRPFPRPAAFGPRGGGGGGRRRAV